MKIDDKIHKRIRWLNTSGGFDDSINTEKILEAARGLDVATVMQVLKDLQANKEKVNDPTAYATSAMRKVGGGNKFGPVWPQPAIATAYMAPYGMAPMSVDDEKTRKRIGWLNREGGFEGAINYSKIQEASVGVEHHVLTLLKQLEEKKSEVKDPTAWVCYALRKKERPSFDDLEPRLRARIGWLNRSGGFEKALKYADIANAAFGADTASVMKILKDLEEGKETIRDPTAYVVGALRKRTAGQMVGVPFAQPVGAFGYGAMPAFVGGDVDLDQKLRKKVGWLNKQGGFEGQILYDGVAKAAAGLNSGTALALLKNLEEKKDEVKDPTAWVTSALRKVGGGSVAHGMPPVGYAMPIQAIQGYGPMQMEDLDSDRKLRKRVGWLNSKGGLDGRLIYEKLAEVAAGVDPAEVMQILKDMENNKEAVRDPTAYVTSAIRKRRSTTMSIPAFSPKGVRKVVAGARWVPKGLPNVSKSVLKKSRK